VPHAHERGKKQHIITRVEKKKKIAGELTVERDVGVRERGQAVAEVTHGSEKKSMSPPRIPRRKKKKKLRHIQEPSCTGGQKRIRLGRGKKLRRYLAQEKKRGEKAPSYHRHLSGTTETRLSGDANSSRRKRKRERKESAWHGGGRRKGKGGRVVAISGRFRPPSLITMERQEIRKKGGRKTGGR